MADFIAKTSPGVATAALTSTSPAAIPARAAGPLGATYVTRSPP
ncbi:MAG TPA: hypothetical protein VEK86_00600 [Gemmatimonadales bacterium]|nr:hypothetical protein [Gemmatimonadales bacterium]